MEDDMNRKNPWVVGGAVAIAFAVTYAACALAYALFPDATLSFFDAWFHGIDITLLKTPKPFTFGHFLYGLVSVVVSAFVVGVVYGYAYNGLLQLAGPAQGDGIARRNRPVV